ncbi:long-chain-fatty-acid--CoA ligase ACSBG2-like isoform X2 [Stegostoma tigrinum]|uniref:long-chain-fatty-acid--CoA ligase ACSBG2-like isoform X2 n=1 Tax=Stegostoma tigrinum TaxID=3053191 RepID=UPI00202B941C|nr:long-chain-fatty-acid--CoA ligase ACSBG2-like isoform X2 [Stegostoma tigrinum]
MGEVFDCSPWLNNAGGDTRALHDGKGEEELLQSRSEQQGFIDQAEIPLGMENKNPEQVPSLQKEEPPTDAARLGDFNNSNSVKKNVESTAEGQQAQTSSPTDSIQHPTKLAPATKLWTTLRDGAVQLRMEETCCGAESPLTIAQMFNQSVANHGNRVALSFLLRNHWETLTYSQYYKECRKAAKSFLKLGLQRFHGVGILGFNSPEWVIANIGAILAGGLAVGIYATNSPEACKHVAHHCEANILVVENHNQLLKILQIAHLLPHLKAIVQYKFAVEEHKRNIFTWKEFLELGKSVSDEVLDEVIESQNANQCCTLIYTSGTTGVPKGAMLSHDNLTWTAKTAGKVVGLQAMGKVQERVVSFLPMSHIAAQMMDIWIPMKFGAATYFAQPDALKGTLLYTLREVRPTAFLGVPRVWEKMEEKMKDAGAESSALKRKIIKWAKGIGLQTSYNMMEGSTLQPFGYTLANQLVFKKVRVLLGLDQCSKCFTGAAPITKETLEYFLSLRITIFELYGMSESSGPHTISHQDFYRITSCGKEMMGCKTKIDKPSEEGTGEVCFWGRHVFMGYLNMPEQTNEALDEMGWLHSGDVGRFDEDGFLYITGRIKELLITAGGENIAPVPIEDAVKAKLPIISNAMLIGDKRKFLSMLLTLKTYMDDETGAPLDQLAPAAVAFCRRFGCPANTVSEVLRMRDPSVYKAIQNGIDAVNKDAISKAQQIQKWIILKKDFSIVGGELGPTMKLKRGIVLKMYKDIIESFYFD